MDYRRDIDGLRAVAVMGVILHHAGFEAIRAGYAGVDVFFVISGFLIGGIVARERASGRFSFRAFYARRARRILPALFAMVLVTLPFAWALMTPDQLRYYGGGAFSTLIFLPNVWFYNRIDYFNPAAAFDPLVHTWSLGVEEQFYIFLPLMLVLLWRFGRGAVVGVLAAIAGLSLGLSILTSDARPLAAFYLIHTRAWELLAGVLAALLAPRIVAALPVPMRAALATLGLVLVAAGLALVPPDAAWPGAWALVPAAGTALVVLFGAAPSPARWLLSTAPFVGVGLVSYSAYLWHQPILGFLAIRGEWPAGPWAKAAVVAAALALAWASWRFIEQPFRTRRLSPALGRGLLAGAAAGIAAFAIGGAVTEGYPGRMSPEVLRVLAYETSWSPTYRACIGGRKEGDRLDPEAACVHGPPARAGGDLGRQSRRCAGAAPGRGIGGAWDRAEGADGRELRADRGIEELGPEADRVLCRAQSQDAGPSRRLGDDRGGDPQRLLEQLYRAARLRHADWRDPRRRGLRAAA